MSTRRESTHERGQRYCRQPDYEREEDHRYHTFSRDRYDEEQAGKRKSRSPHNQDRKKRRKQRSYEKKKSKKSSRNIDYDDDCSYDSYSTSRRRYDGHDKHYHNQRHDEEIRRHDRNDRTQRRRRRRRRRRTKDHKRRNDRNSRRRRRSHSTETYSSRDPRLHRHLEVNVAAGVAIPRTGVVSDDEDEDDYGHHQQRQSPGKHHHIKKNPSSPAQDDTVGHFKGREGCIIADRYRILKEVGMGTFGRVVECLDLSRQRQVDYYRQQQSEDNHYSHHRSNDHRHGDDQNSIVAIKIVRNVKRYYESAIIEADIIQDVNRRGRRGKSHCAILYDTFSFQGHYCIVFESLGPSLYDFLKGHKYHPFPIHCVYDFTLQLLETVEYLHSFRIIHTDLKVSYRYRIGSFTEFMLRCSALLDFFNLCQKHNKNDFEQHL